MATRRQTEARINNTEIEYYVRHVCCSCCCFFFSYPPFHRSHRLPHFSGACGRGLSTITSRKLKQAKLNKTNEMTAVKNQIHDSHTISIRSAVRRSHVENFVYTRLPVRPRFRSIVSSCHHHYFYYYYCL